MADIEYNIDRYFREQLGKLEATPPESSWEKITGRLNQNRKKKALLLFFKIAAGMAILISTGIGVLVTLKTPVAKKVAVVTDQQPLKSTVIKSNDINKPVEGTPQVVLNKPIQSDKSEPMQAVRTQAAVTDETPAVSHEELPASTGSLASKTITTTDNSIQSPPEIALHSIAATIPSAIPLGLMEQPTESETNAEVLANLTPEQARAILLADYQQHEEITEAGVTGWAMGGEIAPQYSYRSISSDKAGSAAINSLNDSESGMLAYSGGVRVAYVTSKRLSVQSGIYYSRYGEQNKDIASSGYYSLDSKSNLVTANDISHVTFTNSTGTIKSKDPDKTGYDVTANNYVSRGDVNNPTQSTYDNNGPSTDASIIQTFDFIELPVIVKYKIIDRKVDFNLAGGLVTNFLFGNSVKLVEDGQKSTIGKTTDISQVNYMGSISIGMEYPLAKEIGLTLEPRFRYCFNSFNESSPIDVHPYSFGIFAGVNYYF